MKLICLGSGSSGNCYVLDAGHEALVIEAGIPFREVRKALKFNVLKIAGVVVSHSHGDHAKYAKEYEAAGIPVYKPYECGTVLGLQEYGGFSISPFDLVHDVPCYGFQIDHPDMGRLVYASDTEYVRYRFQDVSHMLIEANYAADMIPDDAVNYRHVLQGHMELNTTIDFIRANKTPELRNVILCHLSESNADPERFMDEVLDVADCTVWQAVKGAAIPVNRDPF